MQAIGGTSQEGSEVYSVEDKTNLQSKTGNKLDNRKGGQDHKTKHRKHRGKPRKPAMAGPDHDKRPKDPRLHH